MAADKKNLAFQPTFMRVLHVINSMTIGGAEMLLANTLSPGGLQNYTQNVLVYFNGTSDLIKKIDSSVKVICLEYTGLLQLPGVLKKLKKIIKENQIDIIHTHLNPADFYVNLIRPKHIPQVHTLHIAYSTDLETRRALKFLEEKLFFLQKDCNLIFLSQFNKRDFLATLPFTGRGFVLNNFVDDAFFLTPPSHYAHEPKRILKIIAVGNFRQQKNYFYLLDIFKYLKRYNIQLDIHGSGGDIEKFRDKVKESNYKIILKGQVGNINKIIGDYDLFIMPSTNEGFALSVFEAMAASVPVIISNIPPLKNIVKENAIYFELDDPKGAADLLISIYKGEIDINSLASKGRAYAENTVRREKYVKKLLKIYQTILEVQ